MSANKDRRRCGRSGGFTLLEILIAFMIAAVSLAALLGVFSSGLDATHTSARYAKALALGQNLLAGTAKRQPLTAGVVEGRSDGEFAWRRVTTIALEEGEDATVRRDDPVPVRVVVTVSWHEAGNRRQITLESRRIGLAP